MIVVGANSVKNRLNFMEDELYVKGNTVIWSRGLDSCDNLDNGRKTICAYTSSLPIKHAIWCTFYCEHPAYETDLFPVYNKQEDSSGVPVPSVCIVDAHNIQVFTQKGEDFVTALPFQIEKIWNIKYGIFLEKEMDGESVKKKIASFNCFLSRTHFDSRKQTLFIFASFSTG